MKLTKQLEAEILKVYNAYWDSYFKGDMRAFASLLHGNVQLIGSSENEVFSNKRSAMKFYEATAGQVAGKAAAQNRKIAMRAVDNNILVIEQSDFCVLIDNEWTFYGHGRISTLLQKTGKGWKIIHEHGSLPDSKAGEGEQVNTERMKAENRELREAVKRRTVELEHKNRELEIETALERVRAVAMGMKEPADMLEVCKTISLQLESLDVKEIRNVQTAIFYENRGTYMNYEYYSRHQKTIITETSYTNHKVHKAFATRMLRGKGEVFISHIKGKKVKDWIAYQKTTNVFIDKFLEKASSLNYYWHSLGPVALGISTYVPLSKDDLSLFKRFLNVFELAYTRYLDIEQAIAQAREARIETALERVRAVALSMKKPEELPNVCEVLFVELRSLGFSEMRNTMINIHNDEKETFLNYDYSDEIGKSITSLVYNIHPVIEKQIRQIRSSRDAFSETVFTGRELNEWKEFRRRSGEKDDPRINDITALHYFLYSIGTGSIGISTFSSIGEEKLELLKRFRNVFDFAYRRYMDVAQAGAQAREAQIELALERVRARTMAMQKSEELSETAQILFQQFKELGEDPIQITIGIINEEKGIIEFRVTDWSGSGAQVNRSFNVDIDEPTLIHKMYTAWKDQKTSLVIDLSGKELQGWINYRNAISGVSISSGDTKGRRVITSAFFSKGHLSFSTSEPRSPEAIQLLERFAGVFDLTYTRFLDLQKAEAQAREAQIETALERVRSRSMGMQQSEELKEVIKIVYQQLTHLKIKLDHSGFVVDYTPGGDWHFWIADERDIPSKITHPYFESVWANQFNEAKEKGTDFFATHLTFEEKNKFYNELLSYVPGLPEASKDFYLNCPGLAASTVLLDNVGLYIENFSGTPYTDEENRILMRFGKVFQQTYTRFLDLQKAEAQAREAKIEVSLEKVRARTMGMQRSDELPQAANLLFQQIQSLDMPAWSAGYCIWDEDKKAITLWMSSEGVLQPPFRAPLTEDPSFVHMREAYERGETFYTEAVGGEELATHYTYMRTLPVVGEILDSIIEAGHPLPAFQIFHMAYFSQGFLLFITYEAVPEAHDIFKRFGKVFDQTYTRFLDLQKAEAQAREAQIEAALERIRARAMAMHTSDELENVAHILREQMGLLGQPELETSVINLFEEDSDQVLSWHAFRPPELSSGKIITGAASFRWDSNAISREMMEAYRVGQQEHTMEADGAKAMELIRVLITAAPEIAQYIGEDISERVYYHLTYFSGGALLMVSYQPPSEDAKSLQRRAASVFDMAYRRYRDLKKAEAQSRESQIEAALERVRSRTLAMQKSDELAETAAVLFRQLITLGIAPNRLYIAIMKDEGANAEFWITDEDGSKVSTGFSANLHGNGSFQKMLAGWQEGKKSITIDMQGKELLEYFQHLSSLSVPFKGGLSQTRRVQNIAYFSKGFIGMASPDKQPEEATTLLERFAAVFNLTFTRFNDLKLAEAQAHQAHLDLIQLQAAKKKAEEALTELGATQAQLIQQEKLASLGQLTAGIAHEIKNPLNFVNNFSSVSVELVDEVMDEITKSCSHLNTGEVPHLLADIKANLAKIIEHGTRADGIVKSMLQHSRGGGSKMEPTDLNALIKEYVNLAFHGMRASKNPINVDIELDFDKAISNVLLKAEDFSRVIINLCQNAFDAMREKVNNRDKQSGSYLPKLTVRTRREVSRITVQIEDNGPGIPEAIKSKVLQPFFTTKKGTQGTGLGLSITNDIVKAHGGEMKIESIGSGGTAFIIALPTETQK